MKRLLIPAAIVLATAASTLGMRADQLRSRIFFLDIRGGRIVSANTDGSDVKVLLQGHRTGPDGIVVDEGAGHIFWTNMGKPMANDGSIERLDLDGSHLTMVVPRGGTFTPKQLKLDRENRKLYWSDREGMRVMRSNIDGTNIETLVETGSGEEARQDARNWCVGIAVDVRRHKIYWTQKGGSDAGEGSIRRANIEVPKGQTPVNRSDIEVLFDGLPEPIDMDLDLGRRMMYWTDRGDLPGGNSVSRAPMDPPAGATPTHRSDREILITGLQEGIGIALDVRGDRMYFTDLGGNVYSSTLSGLDRRTLLTGQGSATGIAYAELPK